MPDKNPPQNGQHKLTAAQLYGSRNRLTLSPDLLRRVAELLGYGGVEAFPGGQLAPMLEVLDISDVVELIVLSQLSGYEVDPTPEQRAEAATARSLLRRISSGRYLTRKQIHDLLPPETVVLFKMGHPRLWGYAVRQRLPDDAELAIPNTIEKDPTGPYTDQREAWLGRYITDAGNLHQLRAESEEVPVSEDRYQRFRLGMSLVDSYAQVWSSARGHWSVSPDTRYVVPSRYGWCPYVFKIAEEGWRRDEFEGHRDRLMGTRGYWIDVANERLIHLGEPDPENMWLPKTSIAPEGPSDRDLRVAGAITGEIIALGAGQKNPVIRLRQRGRRLY
ncbi:hypothetical protein [Corynebacterium heidelbergense]|uniref:Uncharacterized protein n=1 Tax=Corynebacterium heidelbergense TaxID=2055947 RepID=A0A364VAH7_9CORY|nr:hypothetical protein [Corynebacterium heidelbergense]RAV33649.1 hypothetical protein CWC39_07415 [Corynebacterium heidelbergense]WCZ37509.1 hypothetical protein CHEID_09925 [Corynebacterium heidelbergense]